MMNYNEIVKQKGSRCTCNQNMNDGIIASSDKKKKTSIIMSNQVRDSIKNDDFQNTCGSYCKNLSAQEQKQIIKALLKKKYSDSSFLNSTQNEQIGDRKYLVNA